MTSQQVKNAIPRGLQCKPKTCPYYNEEEHICEVMGEEIKVEYKICGINENSPLTKT